ncbi:GNAT family N-acetyltransferase [Microbacterium aurantiacum]|uniref:GCN5 family acetyltransferase n=1 Tax=Microbacterium aurantiacum TaxID=162393 RepID=A0A0M8MGX9_9MICO|nr:N-acetyltransferase [Microbacterium chocolatum]ANG84187.1 GCN5 family acetyltransferase [Microbacterium chocolatum]KOS09877.1 GCN5 family acetyltransferase [Microbacterium chocolatum]
MSSSSAPFKVRAYRPADEPGWLRCRVLSFLGTQYYDDVKQHRTVLTEPSIAFVAVSPTGDIIGILDVEIDGKAATIDTVATHPDHQGAGVGAALLREALSQLEAARVETLDAWTREDVAANRWYRSHGFSEQYRYLHVYLNDGDDDADFVTPDGLSAPVSAFLHGRIEDEARMRARFRRVYVCRQYHRPIMQP